MAKWDGNGWYRLSRGEKFCNTSSQMWEGQRSFELFKRTRPKPAYGPQGLDWIVGPGYRFAVFSTVGQSDHFS